VVRADRHEALVRVASVNCAECRGCGLLARNREHTMEFTIANRLGVRGGDEVILKVPSRRLSLSYLIMFGLPVLVMSAGYFTGMAVSVLLVRGGSQGVGVIVAVAAGLVSFWLGVKLADRVGLFPSISRVISQEAREDAQEGQGNGDDDTGDFNGRVL
jgi:positive regulator of sigma E activity